MRSVLPFSCAAATLAVLVASSAHATTAAEPVRLVYETGDGIVGCPDVDRLHGAVATRLGYDPFRDDAKRQVTARISRVGSDLRAEIDLRDASGAVVGARTLTGHGCADLASAIAFAISMAIDPIRAMAPPPPPPPPPAEDPLRHEAVIEAPPAPVAAPIRATTASPQSRDEAPPVPRPEERPPAPWVPRVYAGGGVSGLGPVAGVSGLITVGGGIRRGAAAIDIEGRMLPASSEAAARGRVQTSMLGVSLLPCAYVTPMYVCANVTIGALQGEAEAIDAPERATTVLVQAGARLAVALPIQERITLDPFVDGLATLTRTGLDFRGQEVWSTTAFGVSGGAKIAVHFP